MSPLRILPLLLALPMLTGNTSCEAPANAHPVSDESSWEGTGSEHFDDSPACAPVQPLTCGEVVFGDTSDWNGGATDAIDHWPVAVGNYSGPELVYSFDATRMPNVTFSLVNPDPTVVNHDIVVLDSRVGCNKEAAVGYGFSEVEVEVEPRSRYYVVVDGFNGDAGAFGLRADCHDPEAPTVPDVPEDGPECLFGDTTGDAMTSPGLEWTSTVERFARPADMDSVTSAQLDVGWERFEGGATGLDAWDLVNGAGMRMDTLQVPGGPAYDWIRMRLRAGPTLGFIFREGTLDLDAWDLDGDILDCRASLH